MTYRASRLTGLTSWTKLLMPDKIEIGDTKVIVTKYKFFGISSTTENITYAKISSVRITTGLLFSGLIIETSGGATQDIFIKGLPRGTAKQIAEILERKTAA